MLDNKLKLKDLNVYSKSISDFNTELESFISGIKECRKECKATIKEIGELNEHIKSK